MNTILLTEIAYERLRTRLRTFDGQARFITMGVDRALRSDGETIPTEEAAPHGALITNDLFGSDHRVDYFRLVAELQSLRWVQSESTGYDHPLFATLAERGTILTNNHSQAIGIAEYVLWGVLEHFQCARQRASDQAAHRWQRRDTREIANTNWLILGFGAIGQEVAQRARAFGAYVTGVRRNSAPSPHADALITPDRVFDYLGASDVVVCSLPQTPETLNLIDAKFLNKMKERSVLVNVGRGSSVDEDALLAALDAGKPEHAVLDVFRKEPLPEDSAFWDHPRVTVTPHSSSSTLAMNERTDEMIVENIRRYLAGEELRNQLSNPEVIATATRR